MPMRRCSGGTIPAGEEKSRPPTWIVPRSGARKPARVRSIVVLPQPEGPRKVTNSFSAMSRFDILQRAEGCRNALSRSRISMNAMAGTPSSHRRLCIGDDGPRPRQPGLTPG